MQKTQHAEMNEKTAELDDRINKRIVATIKRVNTTLDEGATFNIKESVTASDSPDVVRFVTKAKVSANVISDRLASVGVMVSAILDDCDRDTAQGFLKAQAIANLFKRTGKALLTE